MGKDSQITQSQKPNPLTFLTTKKIKNAKLSPVKTERIENYAGYWFSVAQIPALACTHNLPSCSFYMVHGFVKDTTLHLTTLRLFKG